MIFLGELQQMNGNKHRVGLIHNMPLDAQHGLGKTAQELSEIGVLVESLPPAQPPQGHDSILYVDRATGAAWWEYVPLPQTVEAQRLDALEQENTSLALALVEVYEMLIGGA